MVGKKEGMKPTEEIRDGTVGGFAIAVADQQWHWADVVIDGERIIVTCKDVPNPVAVRYGFTSNPVRCNLYNRQGLPTGPFRTDTWEVPIEVLKMWSKDRLAARQTEKDSSKAEKPNKDVHGSGIKTLTHLNRWKRVWTNG